MEYGIFNGLKTLRKEPESFIPTLTVLKRKAVSEVWAVGPGGGGGGWLEAVVLVCLPLAVPILTLCGSERVLVVSTEPLDDLSCWTTPGVGRAGDGVLPVPLTGGGHLHFQSYELRS